MTLWELIEEERRYEQQKFIIKMKGTALKFRKTFREYGYELLGYSVMLCEDTFIFENEHIASEAADKFEWLPKTSELRSQYPFIDGWWYGKEEIPQTIEDYKKDFNSEPYIIWLNDDVKITKEDVIQYKEILKKFYAVRNQITELRKNNGRKI